jgi:hypothetical protein
MKKGLAVLICLLSILSAAVFSVYIQGKDYEYLMNLGQTSRSFNIYLKNAVSSPKEVAAELERLAQKYSASILKTDYSFSEEIQITKSGIFTNEYLQSLNIDLLSGTLPDNESDYMATFSSGDANQTGRMRDIFQDTPLIFQSMQRYILQDDVSMNGVYLVDMDSENKEDFLLELSQFNNQSKEDLLEAGYGQQFDSNYILIFSVLCIIVTGIYLLMCIFYPVSKRKEISVLKLLGYGPKELFAHLYKSILLLAGAFLLALSLLVYFLIADAPFAFLWQLIGVQGLILLLCIMISWLTLFVINKFSASSVLKGYGNFKAALYFTYLIKFCMMVVLVMVLPSTASSMQYAINDIRAQYLYVKNSSELTLYDWDYIGNEFQEMLSGNSDLDARLEQLFKQLEISADAQYVYTEQAQIGNASQNPLCYMSVNKNFLFQYESLIQTNLADLDQSKAGYIFLPDNIDVSNEAQNEWKEFYRSISFKDPSLVLNNDIEIIIYPSSNQPIFSQSSVLINNGILTLQNPVFFLLDIQNDNTDLLLMNSGIKNPIRIKDTIQNRKAIQEAEIASSLENNNLQFEALSKVYQANTKGYFNVLLLIGGLALGCFLTAVLASYFIMLIVLTSRKKEIFVKKMHGYSLFGRYTEEILLLMAVYICSCLELSFFSKDPLAWSMLVLLLILDAGISLALVGKTEHKQMTALLKGEE